MIPITYVTFYIQKYFFEGLVQNKLESIFRLILSHYFQKHNLKNLRWGFG